MKRTLEADIETNPARYLFIGIDPEGGGIIDGVRRYVYTPNPEDDPNVLSEVLRSFRELQPVSWGMEQGIEHDDIFKYLCGKWESERPPDALPTSLWFVEKEKLGKWKEINDNNDHWMSHRGPWIDIIEFTIDLNVSGDDADRQVDKQTWESTLADIKEHYSLTPM